MSVSRTRRCLLKSTTIASMACGLGIPMVQAAAAEAGRFTAVLSRPNQALEPGEHVLEEIGGRRTLLYLPPSYNPEIEHPFLVMFHGARGDGDSTLQSARASADEHGVILLCPSTQAGTWDGIRGSFARDFNVINTLLQRAFDSCAIDSRHIAIGGFSDGASYGVSLGLINGDLFTHVIAHSPGFIISDNWHGKPGVYVSHGRQDTVLPFDRCGAAIVKRLQAKGYTPRFDVFEGGHTASPEIRSAALAWFTRPA